MARKIESTSVILDDGTRVRVDVMDGIMSEDIVIQGIKAEGYRVLTGEDKYPKYDHSIRDMLIKMGVLS